MNKDILLAAGLGISGVAVGYTVGYLVTKAKYEKALEKEIESVKEQYKLLRKDGPYSDPAEVPIEVTVDTENFREGVLTADPEVIRDTIAAGRAKVQSILGAEGYASPSNIEPEVNEKDEPLSFNAFEDERTAIGEYLNEENVESVEITTETNVRFFPEVDREKPYIIGVQGYMDDPAFSHHSKYTVTYWEDDNTLMDDKNAIVPDIAGSIGLEALTHFGQDSDDPSIVYVRNEKLGVDFEVILDSRSYTEEVLGITTSEEKHRVLKMRENDH